MNGAMTPDERSELAAEYAIGLLAGEDLRQARSLAASDPAFAAEVASWSGQLAPLLDEAPSVEPPAHLFGAIREQIAEPARQGQASNVVQLRRRLTVWRGFAVGASAIAASLALVLVTRPQPVERPPVQQPIAAPPLVASLQAEGSDARLVATWDAAERSLLVAAATGVDPEPGRSHELWVIPADGTPRSIGLLPAATALHLRVSEAMARQLAEGVTLAVSLEPAGGSPTGQPTGRVIAAGTLESLPA